MPDNSLVNLGELSKPATVLIEKVSAGLGNVLLPAHIKRVARAEAEASLVKTKAEIEAMDLKQRAARRAELEQIQHQKNMEDIVQMALPMLADDASPGEISADWVEMFLSRARLVSTSDMQAIWAKLLASEANEPGTFSKRTVNVLADFESGDAHILTKLARTIWSPEKSNSRPIIYATRGNEILKEIGLTFNDLMHLQSLGVIQFGEPPGFAVSELDGPIRFSYFDHEISVKPVKRQIPTGLLLLTRAGSELLSLCVAEKIPSMCSYVTEELERCGCLVSMVAASEGKG